MQSENTGIIKSLLGWIVLFSTLVTLLVTAMQLYFDYQKQLRHIDSQLQQIQFGHLQSLASSVWNIDDRSTRLQLNALLQIPEFQFLAIRGDPQLTLEVGEHPTGRLKQVTYPLIFSQGEFIEKVGQLDIIVDMDRIYDQLRANALVNFMSTGFVVFFVTGFLFILFQSRVIRHLVAIAEQLRSIDLGHTVTPITLARKAGAADELFTVVKSINQMQENLHESVTALHTSEQRYRAFIQNSTESIWRLEFYPPVSLDTVPSRQVEDIYRRAVIAECNDAFAQAHGAESSEFLRGRRFSEVSENTPELKQLLGDFIANDYRVSNREIVERSTDGEALHFLRNTHGVLKDGKLINTWGTDRNVSELKKIESHLQDETDFNESIVEHAPIGLHVIDTEGICVRWNSWFENYFSVSKADILGQNLFDVLPGLIELGWRDRYLDVLTTGKLFEKANHKTKLSNSVSKDQVVYQNIKITPLYQGGKITGAITILEDVTKWRETELALQKSETELRDLQNHLSGAIESFSEGFVLYDADNKFVLCNEKFRYLNEDVVSLLTPGTPLSALVRKLVYSGFYGNDPEDAEAFYEKRYRQLTSEQATFDFRQPDGRWIRVNRFPTPDGGGAIVRTDISGLKHTELELRKTQEELQAQFREINSLRNYLNNIIDSMPSILVGVDRSGIITQWNRQAADYTQCPASDAIGRPLEKIFPRLSIEMQRVHDAIQSREVQIKTKMSLHEHNTNRYEDITVFPLIANGVEGAVIRVDDITEQVQIEEMMIQSEKMLSIGGLAAGMAHEINNPLAGIMQNLQLAKTRLDGERPKNREVAEYCNTSMGTIGKYMSLRGVIDKIDVALECGHRATDIVQNMLSFSRKSESHFRPTNLAELIDKTIELAANDYDLKKRYDFRQIEIERNYPYDLPDVPCESTKIQQVILNLLKNGAQAMADSRQQHPKITIDLDPQFDSLEMRFTDNGPGMDEDTKRRIFEPFFTTKGVGMGTGLGLSVSYFIVTDNHGGQMSVLSSPGQGSTFSVSLPLQH